MIRTVDTIIAVILGLLTTSMLYLIYHGITSFTLPKLWISVVLVLFLATASVSFDPAITGNVAVDSFLSAILVYLGGAVIINGLISLFQNPPELETFLLYSMVISLLIRGYFWAEEDVSLGI